MPEPIIREHTVNEVIELIFDAEKRGHYVASDSSHKEGNGKWAGASWEDSMKLVLNGWKQGVPKLDTIARTTISESLRPKPVWDVAGSECDVAAYLAGVPECMGETVRRHRPIPVVKIGIDRAASSFVRPDQIERVGRNVLVLVEALRLSGAASEVYMCHAITPTYGATDHIFAHRIRIQEAGRPVDVSRLAYWAAHPAALRRTVFALDELEPPAIRNRFGIKPGGGYGAPAKDWDKKNFDEWAPSVHSSQADLNTWVQDVLGRRIGR